MNELIEKKIRTLDKLLGEVAEECYQTKYLPYVCEEKIKSFLETSLKECWEKAQEEERKRIVEGLPKKKPQFSRGMGKSTPKWEQCENIGFNEAVDEIKRLLK